jgi:hypothetical protein
MGDSIIHLAIMFAFSVRDRCRTDIWRLSNPDKAKDIKIKWAKENPEKEKSYRRKWAINNPDKNSKWSILNPEKRKTIKKDWEERNPDYRKEYISNRTKIDIEFRIGIQMRSRLNKAIKGNFKSGSAVRDLGCSVEYLKAYLEGQFEPGMSWKNWSLKGWHIDHIRPLSSFDLTDREQFLQAIHYTNLQPMWAEENLKKGKKY